MRDFNRARCASSTATPDGAAAPRSWAEGHWTTFSNCETRLLIIDDLHFLHWQNKGGIEISNNFKYIVNDFPITLISIGIGLSNAEF